MYQRSHCRQRESRRLLIQGLQNLWTTDVANVRRSVAPLCSALVLLAVTQSPVAATQAMSSSETPDQVGSAALHNQAEAGRVRAAVRRSLRTAQPARSTSPATKAIARYGPGPGLGLRPRTLWAVALLLSMWPCQFGSEHA